MGMSAGELLSAGRGIDMSNSTRSRFIRLRDYARDYSGNSDCEKHARRIAAANAWAKMDGKDRARFNYDPV